MTEPLINSYKDAYRVGRNIGFVIGVCSVCSLIITIVGAMYLLWLGEEPQVADTACPVPTRNSYIFLPPDTRR